MASRFDLANIWRNVKELDLQQIRSDAEQEVRLAIAGADPDALQTLANQLRSDPRRPDEITHTLIPLFQIEEEIDLGGVDLLLLLVTTDPDLQARQGSLLAEWAKDGRRAILIFDPEVQADAYDQAVSKAGGFPHVFASVEDWPALHTELAPAIVEELLEFNLALGRRFPLLRETVARNLILDTSSANAAYSFSTGLAEIIPILDIPLNVADIIILTKAQALLVYKLGLALGMSTDWQFYVGELSGVIGSGFLWRQVARSLVGLIPAWGIVPKVAVAYSGTYVVGQAVLHWYQTGRHLSKKKMRQLSRSAARRGKSLAQNLRRKKAETEEGERPTLPEATSRVCPLCQTENDVDARYCKHCAQPLAEPGPESSD